MPRSRGKSVLKTGRTVRVSIGKRTRGVVRRTSGRDITSTRTYTGITSRPLGTNMVTKTKMTIITQILPSVKENNNLFLINLNKNFYNFKNL